MLKKNFVLFCAIVVVACCCWQQVDAGLYGPSSKVIQLNADNFASEVFGSNDVWLVEFYAPWCGHCKRLTPEWEKAAAKLEGFVKVAAIDCDVEANKGLAGYFGVRGFPTIKFFGHETVPSPDGKGVVKKPVDYQGAREAGPITQYALAQLPGEFVSALSAKSAPQWFEENAGSGQVLLFTDKPRTTALYKALSLQFAGRMAFAQIHSAHAAIAADYDVTEFPTLIVQAADGERHVYDGKLKMANLQEFVGRFAPAKKRGQKASSSSSSSPPPPPPPPAEPEPFRIFDLESQSVFDEQCVQRPGLCVIGFFDSTSADHESYVQTFDALATANQKSFRFFRVDSVSHANFASQFDVSMFPSLAVFSPSKKLYTPFIGAFSQDPLSRFLSLVLRGKKRPISLDSMPSL